MDNGKVKLDSNLTHTCPKCAARFPHSGLLVQHMKDSHPSFVEHAQSRIPRNPMPMDKEPVDTGPYRNTIATCPFCKQDCQTRKKLMRHLELEHKDDNEHDDDTSQHVPEVKVIRLDDQNKQRLLEQLAQRGAPSSTNQTHSQPVSEDSSVVQDLLKVFSSSNANTAPMSARAEPKTTSAKSQYRCFWCDASFRKRGKLMDHIDLLHKHNKQQNQVEADLLNHDEPSKPISRQGSGHAAVPHTFSPPQTSMASTSIARPSFIPPITTASSDHKVSVSNCSFRLLGRLKPTTKLNVAKEPIKENLCKFYFGKKGNPVANVRLPVMPRQPTALRSSAASRRYSLPNMLDTMQSQFYHRMMSPTSLQALQQSYMLAMRPAMMSSSSFYQHRMPLMVPSSDFLLGQNNTMFDPTSQAQFIARVNAMRMASSPRPAANAESPLDLTKNFL